MKHESKTYSGDPHYKFFSEEDCKLFQDSIRSKDLVLVYDVDKISFKTSDSLGDATDQHLKIWREFDGGQFALSFFANNPSDPKGRRHREFRLACMLLVSNGAKTKAGVVHLDFKAAQNTPARRSSRCGTSGGVGVGAGVGGGGVQAGPGLSGLSSPRTAELDPSISAPGRSSTLVDRAVGPDVPTEPQAGRSSLPLRPHRPSMVLSMSHRRGDANASLSTPPQRPSLSMSTGSSGRVHSVNTLAVADETSRPARFEDEEDAGKLRFMEIVFSEAQGESGMVLAEGGRD